MPEDKRNPQKGKSEAKEQRKPRQGKQKPGHAAKTAAPSAEKKSEQSKVPQKPVYEDPGPEFYKNLKRETDDILKITEEANSKYKKKEIQSNWSKYEMPIESYEDIEQHENLGADYEQLVQMPLSVGGHFQFKHEKSWVAGGAAARAACFHIDMGALADAVCSLPFYQRNAIPKHIFSEADVLTMDHRAIKYKQKYYNDKSYNTPSLEANDKMLNNFKEAFSKPDTDDRDLRNNDDLQGRHVEHESPEEIPVQDSNPIEFRLENKIVTDLSSDLRNVTQAVTDTQQAVAELIDDIDDLILGDKESNPLATVGDTTPEVADIRQAAAEAQVSLSDTAKLKQTCTEHVKGKGDQSKSVKLAEAKTPVIESPEDLEKWLDDFLDG